MCKTGYYRNDIWVADIKETYQNVIKGKHPVLIISGFKHNLKADTVNVAVITSNIKRKLQSHVLIEGYGLKKESKILCEQILTINKADLINKIGRVDNIKMLEINTTLKTQLQLDNKHKNFESEELEIIFLKGVKKMDEQRNLNILKSNVKLLYLEEKNDECIRKCAELISQAEQYSHETRNSFLWYAYYAQSLIYMRLNEIDQALINAKESIKYVNTIDVFNQEYSLSMWALARCYEETDLIKAAKIYKILGKVYREVADNKLRTSCLFNYARIKRNIKAMKCLVEIVEKTSSNKWYFGVNKEIYLNNMRTELNAIIA